MSVTNALLVTKMFEQIDREPGLFHVTLKMVFAQVVKTLVAKSLFFGQVFSTGSHFIIY